LNGATLLLKRIIATLPSGSVDATTTFGLPMRSDMYFVEGDSMYDTSPFTSAATASRWSL